jgi:hypothetical protein
LLEAQQEQIRQLSKQVKTTRGRGRIKMTNRRRTLLGSALLMLVLLVSSTFAFVMLNQAAFNPDRVRIVAGGRLHDVMERRGEGVNRDRAGERNHDVFAENFGEMPIGVRVRFSEYLASVKRRGDCANHGFQRR